MTYEISEYTVALNLFFQSKLLGDGEIHNTILSSARLVQIVVVYNQDVDMLLSSNKPITEDIIKTVMEKVRNSLVKTSAVAFI